MFIVVTTPDNDSLCPNKQHAFHPLHTRSIKTKQLAFNLYTWSIPSRRKFTIRPLMSDPEPTRLYATVNYFIRFGSGHNLNAQRPKSETLDSNVKTISNLDIQAKIQIVIQFICREMTSTPCDLPLFGMRTLGKGQGAGPADVTGWRLWIKVTEKVSSPSKRCRPIVYQRVPGL